MRIKEVYFRWVGILVLGLLVGFLVEFDHDRSKLFCVAISLVFTAVFWNGAFLLFIFFRKKFPLIRQTPKRLILTIISLILFISFGGVPLKFVLGILDTDHLTNINYYFEYAHINFPLAFAIGIIYEAVYFFDNWKNTIRVNEALKNQQIRTQFEVLKNQMSPHFLFNSLNTLTALIAEKNDKALEFTQCLSDVYRYILRQKEKELVTIGEELQFVHDYIFLLQMRYPENLIVTVDVGNEFKDYYIAPLTLQMLVENAIKHNVISNRYPLNILIGVENNHLVVSNNIQPKSTMEQSTKTGLENIKKRYEYFGNKEVRINNDNQHFIVDIPLIKLKSESELIIASQIHESIDH